MVIENSLVISHGQYGIVEDYPGTVLHTTLVNSGRVPTALASRSALIGFYQEQPYPTRNFRFCIRRKLDGRSEGNELEGHNMAWWQ